MSFRTTHSAPRSTAALRCAVWTVALLLTTTLPLASARDAVAQAAPAPQTAPQSGVSLRGTVADPDDAEIPGAALTLTPSSGKAITGTSGSDGTYSLRGVPTGTYSLTVTMPGFATFVRQGVKITAGTPVLLNVKMTIQDATTVINVTTDANTVSVDQDSNASATVLTGKDLDALSDDPDELASELSALAGPAAGPNGGQIYIDGFTGGQLPPKSSIREIRINQNPFSAQYDRAGFGRVEIFTKPGTDKFHGSANVQGQDKSFNSGSPFVLPGTLQPDYHTILSQGSLTGPINKKASFTLAGSYRQIQDNSVVNPPSIYATSPSAQTSCYPGTAGCTTFSQNQVFFDNGTLAAPGGNPFSTVQLLPQVRYDISPRVDLALGDKNTLTTRFSYEHNSGQNVGIGGNDIFSTGSNSTSSEVTLQMTDTQILSAKVINETRFEYQRELADSTPFSTAPSIVVQGAFVGGGSSAGTSDDVQNHIEVQNYTSIALKKNFIRLGGRLRTTSDTNTTTAGQNGTFTYASMADFLSGVPNCPYTAGSPQCTGLVTQYSITHIAVPTITARSTDVGLYAETDWKVKPNLTFSYGLRFETQNYIHDHADFAPRASVAYGISKKTVLRAGAGLFYDRFMLTNQLSVFRNNGMNQQQDIISATPATSTTAAVPVNPACNPSNASLTTACPVSTAGRFTTDSISSRLRAPYSAQFNLGVDQQLFRGATLSVNYQHIRGVHQFNDDVANFNTLSATTPIQYQYQSEGVFNQNQLISNINYRAGRASIFGFYVLNFAKSDTSGVNSFGTNPYNLGQDYGRASFDTRNRVFLGGNVTLPFLVGLSPLLVANSGSPYNVTTGTDNNGDTIFNDRAAFASTGTAGAKTIGCGTFINPTSANGSATPGAGAMVPINYCTGPANFTVNLRATKTFGFGESTQPDPNRRGQNGQGGPAGARPPGGPGGPGGGGGGGTSSGKRYNLIVGLQVQNIFNIVDRGAPVGTLSSPEFGESTALAGNIFTSNSAVRRIYLQTSFNF
jgi:Carboxypeptidase regulatory-like domain